MDGKKYHEKKRKQVLTLCRDLKSTYGEDWKYIMPVLFPDSFTYLKQIKRLKEK